MTHLEISWSSNLVDFFYFGQSKLKSSNLVDFFYFGQSKLKSSNLVDFFYFGEYAVSTNLDSFCLDLG